MKLYLINLLVWFALLFAVSSYAQGNLVVNGSFETGDFTGWTVNGEVGAGSVHVFQISDAFNGSYLAQFNSNPGNISQGFSTESGAYYTLSFAAVEEQGTNFFSVTAGSLSTAVNFASTVPINNEGIFNTSWENFSYTFQATSDNTTLTFNFNPQTVFINNNSDFNGIINLDAISVTAVPEPSAMVLSGISLMILCGYVWWRYKHEKSFSKQ